MNQDQKQTSRRPRIKKGDEVMVIAGADKGKTGRVLTVYPRESRILVEGIHVVRRAYRQGANPAVPQGGFHDKELPIHISNVMLLDPKSGDPTRVGVRYDVNQNGKKVRVRIAKASGTDIKE